MIVLFSMKFDYATSAVMHWLNACGAKVVRLNRDDHAYRLEGITEEGIYFRHRQTGEVINLNDAQACWWRREGLSNGIIFEGTPEKLVVDPFDLTALRNNKLNSESAALLDYIRDRLLRQCPLHLGSPFVTSLNRLVMYDLARECGFKTPRYAVVTRNDQVAQAGQGPGNDRLVSKAVHEGMYNMVSNHRLYSYTEELEPELLAESERGEWFPSLAMSLVEKKFEIRSFYLDGQFYSSAIFSQASAQTKVDFRKYNKLKPNRVEPYVLPKAIENRLARMYRALDLNCGSADIIIDQDNDYVFLEINPVGQYHMVSDPCNYNLDKVIANYLMHGKLETAPH